MTRPKKSTKAKATRARPLHVPMDEDMMLAVSQTIRTLRENSPLMNRGQWICPLHVIAKALSIAPKRADAMLREHHNAIAALLGPRTTLSVHDGDPRWRLLPYVTIDAEGLPDNDYEFVRRTYVDHLRSTAETIDECATMLKREIARLQQPSDRDATPEMLLHKHVDLARKLRDDAGHLLARVKCEFGDSGTAGDDRI